MTLVDQARQALEPDRRERSWHFDWSALPDGVAAALLASQHERVFMTSGSTGEPKPISCSADMLIRELDSTKAILGAAHDWVHATVHPSSRYGSTGTCIAARYGIPVTFDVLGTTREQIRGTNPLIFTVPTSWRSLHAALQITKCESMTIVHAGCMLPPAVLDYAEAHSSICQVELLDFFGTTETGLIGVRRAYPDPEPAWTVCADTELVFPELDEQGESRPEVTSPRVANGVGHAARASVELDDWLFPAGTDAFGFRGRRERLAKPGGKRVDLDQLEYQIGALLPEFHDIACRPRRHRELGEDIELLVDCSPRDAAEIAGLIRHHSAESLIHVPKWVTAIDLLPRSPMGKVRHSVLPVSDMEFDA